MGSTWDEVAATSLWGGVVWGRREREETRVCTSLVPRPVLVGEDPTCNMILPRNRGSVPGGHFHTTEQRIRPRRTFILPRNRGSVPGGLPTTSARFAGGLVSSDIHATVRFLSVRQIARRALFVFVGEGGETGPGFERRGKVDTTRIVRPPRRRTSIRGDQRRGADERQREKGGEQHDEKFDRPQFLEHMLTRGRVKTKGFEDTTKALGTPLSLSLSR